MLGKTRLMHAGPASTKSPDQAAIRCGWLPDVGSTDLLGEGKLWDVQDVPRTGLRRDEARSVRCLPKGLQEWYCGSKRRREPISIDGARTRRTGLGTIDRRAVDIRAPIATLRQRRREPLTEQERNEQEE